MVQVLLYRPVLSIIQERSRNEMKTKYVEAPITEYLHRKASKLLTPLSGTFELTPVCNMSRRMCYVRMTREEQESVRPLRTAEE